jgi:hypothetical protein
MGAASSLNGLCGSLHDLEVHADDYEVVVIVNVGYSALVTHPKLPANSMVSFPNNDDTCYCKTRIISAAGV